MTEIQIDNPFVEQRVAEIYDRYSAKYHGYRRSLDSFGEIVSTRDTILEIGVGTGAFTNLLLSAGYAVIGIDRSEQMLKIASEQVKSLTQKCDLLDYVPVRKFDVIVSHSGGFTFKQAKFETYYQKKGDLERALKIIHQTLGKSGRFLVNKETHEREIDLGNGAKITIEQEEDGQFRIYKYIFRQGDEKIVRTQRRLVLTADEMRKTSAPYFR